jgi:putative transposase
MVYRLLALFRRNPSPGTLLPNRGGRAPGTRLLSDEVEAVIRKLIASYYLAQEKPRVVDLHRQITLECRHSNLSIPSYKAVWRRLNAIDAALSMKSREGAKRARDRFTPVKAGICAKRPLELVQIDHTLADIMVVD